MVSDKSFLNVGLDFNEKMEFDFYLLELKKKSGKEIPKRDILSFAIKEFIAQMKSGNVPEWVKKNLVK